MNERAEAPIRLRPRTWIPLLVLIGLALHYFLPRIATVEGSLTVVRTMLWWPLVLAVVAQVFSYAANGSLLSTTVAFSGERLSLSRATAMVTAASTVCLIAGGVLGYAASIYQWIRRRGIGRETAAIAATAPPAFDGAALLVFAIASAAELLWHGELATSALRGVIVVTALMLLIAATTLTALIAPDLVHRLVRPLLDRSRFRDRFESVERTLEVVRQTVRSGGAVRATTAALLNLLFDIVSLAFVFIATGYAIGPLVLIGGYGVPLLLGRSSLLPGGIAVVEVGMIAAYVSLGVPANVAVVAILAYRLISFWIPTLAGIPVAVFLQTRSEPAHTPSHGSSDRHPTHRLRSAS